MDTLVSDALRDQESHKLIKIREKLYTIPQKLVNACKYLRAQTSKLEAKDYKVMAFEFGSFWVGPL
jgi:hypothetical protein